MVTSLVAFVLAVGDHSGLDLKDMSWFGRVAVESGGVRMQWPATGFGARFSGTDLSVTIEDSAPGTDHATAGKNSNAIGYRVDGGAMQVLTLKPGVHEYELAKDLRVGNHTVEVFKRTESSVGWIRVIDIDGGKFGPLQDEDRPVLEVYGDSNSCAYGVEAAGRDVNYSPSTQDATKSYGFLATEEAGWRLSLICASGWGVIRGYGGDPIHNIPSIYDRVFWQEADSASPKSDADAILVVLGDNDFVQGDPGDEYDKKYLAFVKNLRKRSPGAPIILALSAMMGDSETKRVRSRVSGVIDMIKQETGDPLIQKIEFPRYQADWGWGADWHFSVKAHQELAKTLTPVLKKISAD